MYIYRYKYFENRYYLMTFLGEFLARRSVNRASVSRRTGFSTSRLNELSLTDTTKLRAEEVYLIAMAIDVDPGELLKVVCGHLQLRPDVIEPKKEGAKRGRKPKKPAADQVSEKNAS